jgi:hypothetical protein
MPKSRIRPVWLLLIVGLCAGILFVYQVQEKMAMPQSSHIEDELKRTRSLLKPDRVKTDLVEIAPDPLPETIGALAGLGFEDSELDVSFSVYVFEDWDGSNAGIEKLKSLQESDSNVYSRTIMNGTLVFHGAVRIDGADGSIKQFRLAKFVSAFAGKE